jgi:hypothetical protein
VARKFDDGFGTQCACCCYENMHSDEA